MAMTALSAFQKSLIIGQRKNTRSAAAAMARLAHVNSTPRRISVMPPIQTAKQAAKKMSPRTTRQSARIFI